MCSIHNTSYFLLLLSVSHILTPWAKCFICDIRVHIKYQDEPFCTVSYTIFFCSDTALTINNLMDVYTMIYSARIKWFDIGLLLKIDFDTLRSIRGNCSEDSHCLREMLACRIQQSDHSLTLRELCECLRSKTVGRIDVAKEIEKGIYCTYTCL